MVTYNANIIIFKSINKKMFLICQFQLLILSACMHVCGVASVMSNSVRPYGACQAPLYLGFSRQEYWSGLLFPLQFRLTKTLCIFDHFKSTNGSLDQNV